MCKWMRLEGAWTKTSTLSIGGPTIRSTVTFSPLDLLGRRALVRLNGLSVDVSAMGYCPSTYYMSDMVGEVAMTGPKTTEATAVGYGLRRPTEEEIASGNTRDQVECIWVGTGLGQFTGPDSAMGTDYLSVYLAEQDQDGNMLPDEGETPVLCIPLCYEVTRIPMMPPCESTLPPLLPCPYPGQ